MFMTSFAYPKAQNTQTGPNRIPACMVHENGIVLRLPLNLT